MAGLVVEGLEVPSLLPHARRASVLGAFLPAGLWAAPLFQNVPDRRRSIFRKLQCALAVIVLGIRVGAPVEEFAADVCQAAGCREKKRRCAVGSGIHLRSGIQ